MNQGHGFRVAFRDAETGIIYGSCYADGRPAAVHLLDGLPESLVLARAVDGRVAVVKKDRRRRLCPERTLLYPRGGGAERGDRSGICNITRSVRSARGRRTTE